MCKLSALTLYQTIKFHAGPNSKHLQTTKLTVLIYDFSLCQGGKNCGKKEKMMDNSILSRVIRTWDCMATSS